MKNITYYERLWMVVFSPVIACMLAFYKVDEIRVGNLLNIEFSKNFQEFKGLIGSHSNEILINNHYFDFIFIFLYTLLFIVSLKLVFMALGFATKKRWFLICLIPGVLDCVENLLFFKLLDGKSNAFDFYFWAVRLKWAVVIIYLQILLAITLFYVLLNLYRLARSITQIFSKPA